MFGLCTFVMLSYFQLASIKSNKKLNLSVPKVTLCHFVEADKVPQFDNESDFLRPHYHVRQTRYNKSF